MAGGAQEGTPELYVGDPNGFVVQLQDPRYCGGAGSLGNVCPAPAPSPRRGLLALRGWSHTTNSRNCTSPTPTGLIIQLQDVSYCGGSGVLGNVCT